MIKMLVNVERREDLSYPIYIGENVLDFLVKELTLLYPSSVVVVTDEVVAGLHLDRVRKSLGAAPFPLHVIVLPAGEKHKNRRVKEKVEDEMLRLKVDRKSVVVALGGGVIGDLAGFVSATYHRGILYIQVPTTLLAMVDSSIGGKVGVDTQYGKNTIGAFHQPKAVIMDISFLDTLPEMHFRNGLVEVIKHSVIKDKNFYAFLGENSKSILSRDRESLVRAIEWSCRIKKEVVGNDERETGLRKILNFGHTVGHAIELLSNYKILHGFAVSVGMLVESLISVKLGILPKEEYNEILEILSLFGLPTRFDDIGLRFSRRIAEKMVGAMRGDKKSVSMEINISLPERIGKMVESHVVAVEPGVILEALMEFSAL